ncbi:hypothetical protein [Streptomyces regalis]|uniref:Uncharacterized protein n=1 Tax=Streptomyces regalis TaxID=68262 RepID=A0A101JGY2_9ACTN|nr:hypothetical protein [Streptomyces regalis]KUL26653.1 hypothetical protein ADL12_32385 [Streptomyces regalis]
MNPNNTTERKHEDVSNKKSTVKAAKAEIKREMRGASKPPASTQGALADRYVRSHTPDSLYGEDKNA